ncbi:MAG: hypothetical protein NTX15_06365 [Candidatus Kapabacteria bacterium]|nr:hypothetical protein [Candidatus Kapabacteria bacterium]
MPQTETSELNVEGGEVHPSSLSTLAVEAGIRAKRDSMLSRDLYTQHNADANSVRH